MCRKKRGQILKRIFLFFLGQQFPTDEKRDTHSGLFFVRFFFIYLLQKISSDKVQTIQPYDLPICQIFRYNVLHTLSNFRSRKFCTSIFFSLSLFSCLSLLEIEANDIKSMDRTTQTSRPVQSFLVFFKAKFFIFRVCVSRGRKLRLISFDGRLPLVKRKKRLPVHAVSHCTRTHFLFLLSNNETTHTHMAKKNKI